MKNLFNIDLKLILLIVFAGLFFFNECSNIRKSKANLIKVDGKTYEKLKHQIDTTILNYQYTVTKEGDDIYHDTTIYVPIPIDVPVDTAQILADYFAKNVFKDTLFLPDSMGYVSVTDTVNKNMIVYRDWNNNVNKIYVKEQLVVKDPPKAQLYLGINGTFNRYDFVSSLGTAVIFKSKNDKLYQLGVGLNNRTIDGVNGNVHPYIGGGMYWKIKK